MVRHRGPAGAEYLEVVEPGTEQRKRPVSTSAVAGGAAVIAARLSSIIASVRALRPRRRRGPADVGRHDDCFHAARVGSA
jgi:hypothetical protein